MMKRTAWVASVLGFALLASSVASGQAAPERQAARGAQRPAGRAGVPTPTPGMNLQQFNTWMETYAVIEAQKALMLTDEQYPNFVGRFRKLQEIGRRRQNERRRMMNDLQSLLGSNTETRDAAILARLRALEEATDSAAAETKKAYQDLDAVLTPWQRGRLRIFEQQLERQKVDLLAKLKIAGG